MTVTIPAYTTVYGAATFNYASGMVITVPPALAADVKKLSATFTVGDITHRPIHPFWMWFQDPHTR